MRAVERWERREDLQPLSGSLDDDAIGAPITCPDCGTFTGGFPHECHEPR